MEKNYTYKVYLIAHVDAKTRIVKELNSFHNHQKAKIYEAIYKKHIFENNVCLLGREYSEEDCEFKICRFEACNDPDLPF